MKRKIGIVSEEEKLTIQRLHERKSGLAELAKIVSADSPTLYEKLIADMGKTSVEFQNWWDKKSEEYSWERDDNGNWEIDFETNEIYLVIND